MAYHELKTPKNLCFCKLISIYNVGIAYNL